MSGIPTGEVVLMSEPFPEKCWFSRAEPRTVFEIGGIDSDTFGTV